MKPPKISTVMLLVGAAISTINPLVTSGEAYKVASYVIGALWGVGACIVAAIEMAGVRLAMRLEERTRASLAYPAQVLHEQALCNVAARFGHELDHLNPDGDEVAREFMRLALGHRR